MASLEPGAVVTNVARRFDVTRQQVYDWRRAARRGELGMPGGVMGFVEVVAGPQGAASDRAMAAPGVTVEIVLVGGRVLRLIGAVEGA
jgi:transposase